MRVEVYGHSDDCIEVDGDLREEFSAYDCAKFLHFGDGTVLEVEYAPEDDAEYYWRIRTVKVGTAQIEMLLGKYAGENGMKCDKVVLTGDLKSVECYGSADGATTSDLEDFLEELDYSSLTREQQLRIMQIAKE